MTPGACRTAAGRPARRRGRSPAATACCAAHWRSAGSAHRSWLLAVVSARGQQPRRGGRAVAHDVEPDAQLVLHRGGQVSDRRVEPADHGGLAVFLQHPGLGQHVGDDGSGVLDPRQQRHVAAPDRRAGGVLDAEHDPDRALDSLGLLRGPAVAGGVLADELVEGRLQGRIGRRREAEPHPGSHVPGHVQQDQLAVGRPAAAASCPAGRSSSHTGACRGLPGGTCRRWRRTAAGRPCSPRPG